MYVSLCTAQSCDFEISLGYGAELISLCTAQSYDFRAFGLVSKS